MSWMSEPPETLLSGTYGYNDRIHWSLDLETGELKLWGNPSWVNSDMSSTSADIPWSSYRSSVQTVNISQGVKRVGYYAFQGGFDFSKLNWKNKFLFNTAIRQIENDPNATADMKMASYVKDHPINYYDEAKVNRVIEVINKLSLEKAGKSA